MAVFFAYVEINSLPYILPSGDMVSCPQGIQLKVGWPSTDGNTRGVAFHDLPLGFATLLS